MGLLADPQTPELSESERIALRFAEQLTVDAHQVQDTLFTRLRAHFDEGQIVELASVAGLFNYFNRFNEALQMEITR